MIVHDLVNWDDDEKCDSKDKKNQDTPPPGESLKIKKTRNVGFYLALLYHNPVQCFCSLTCHSELGLGL